MFLESWAVGATVLAAAGDITRFPTKRKFACYFGITQRIKQTGGHPAHLETGQRPFGL